MPIRDIRDDESFRPTRGEVTIATKLRESGGTGLSYSEIKRSADLSDAALAKFLRRMQHRHLVGRDLSRRYHLTVIGMVFLMSLSPRMVSKEDRREQRKRDLGRLWRKVRALQEEVLRVCWLPYADTASRMFFNSSGSFDLVYIGALKSKGGKEILSMKTPGIEELRRLGYS